MIERDYHGDEVAVVSLACRLPAGDDADAVWRSLRDGVECVTDLAPAELRAAGVSDAEMAGPGYVARRPLLRGADRFDAPLFGFSPAEAAALNPQHRLFLECAWEALELGGHGAGGERVGVFGGSSLNRYFLNVAAAAAEDDTSEMLQLLFLNDKDYLTSLVAYKLNLLGPSVAVQSACSSSLVAVHTAVQSLLNGECDLALAGGATISVPERRGYTWQPGGLESPDGHCRAFDARAQGTIMGSGVGVVLLRPLEDALADGDPVLAVIRGSAINNDGARKVGYTAPSVEGQAEVIAAALRVARVAADTVEYVEGHGSGTPLGDPIEVAALTRAFRGRTRRGQYCALGSIKTNLGHLDSAAGVAGLIKTVLMLRHRTLVPSLNYERPNPQIDFAAGPFFVNTATRAWPGADHPRRAGVSSFGIGGTNAHVVLEEAPEPAPSGPARPWQLLALSAASQAALEQAADRLADHLAAHPEVALADVAFTLREGRRAFPQRRVLVVHQGEDAAALLRDRSPERTIDGTAAGRAPVAFLFPGLGDHYPGMARGLYEREPVFRAEVDRCAELLRGPLGLDLRDVLFPGPPPSEAPPAASARLDFRAMLGRSSAAPAGVEAEALRRTEIAHPALFVVEYALARLWMSAGIVPGAVIGHSLGEYAAACVAGVMSLEDALAVVAARARLVAELPGGAMLPVYLPRAEVEAYLTPELTLAAVNAPELCVVSGPAGAVHALAARLAADGFPSRPLPTEHAFHSPMMEGAAAPLGELLAGVALHPPKIPLLAGATGSWMTPAEATDPAYWARQLSRPVRFADAAAELLAEPGRFLVEMGPGATLVTFVQQQALALGTGPVGAVASLPRAYDGVADAAAFLRALGQAWVAGAEPRWAALREGETRRRVALPTYPFQRERHWVEPREAAPAPAPPGDGTPRKTADLAGWFFIPSWRRTLPASAAASPDEPRRWLLLADQGGIAGALAERLRAHGHDVHLVRAGDDPAPALDAVAADAGGVDEVVHLASLSPAPAERDEAGEARESLHAFLALVRELAPRAARRPIRLQVVTAGAQAVDSGDRASASCAPLLAACRVVPQEEPGLPCRTVDIEPPPCAAAERDAWLARLAAELASRTLDPTVAYRGPLRFAQAFEPAPITAAGPLPLREGGAYLVTGGLSGVGLQVAAFLAREARASLVLTARTPLPPRERWEAVVAAPGAAARPLTRTLERLLALEAAGARVMTATVDVADEAGMRGVLAAAEARFGPLAGVVHAAGVTSGPSIAPALQLTREGVAEQLRAKVGGTTVLERLLPDGGPEFVLLVSSTAAVLGGLGYTAYGAANAFLDAFAVARHGRTATRWVSAAWDAWPREARGAAGLDLAMTPDEAHEALRRVLSAAAVPHVVVAIADLPARLRRWVRLDPPAAPGAAPSASSPRARRQAAGAAYVAPRDELEARVEEMWSALLGVEAIGVNDHFFQLGGHSLMGMRLLGRVRQEMGVELPVESLFHSPTIAGMAAAIRERQSGAGSGERAPSLLDELRAMQAGVGEP